MSNRKRTNRQYNVQLFCWTLYCLFVLFLLDILLSVRPFSVGHYIVCSSFFCWTLYCLFVLFLLDITLSARPFSPTEKGRTDNIMSNRKRTNRQYNVQQKKDEQTIKCPTEKGRTDNIMSNRKGTNRQYNVQQKNVLFLLDIILSGRPFSVGHYIVCSSLFCWILYCLFVLFLLDIILQYNVQQKKDEQTI
jgi:hypothetical protein